MNPHLAHIYQLISLLMFSMALISDQAYISFPPVLDMEKVLALGAFLTFWFSVGKPSITKRALFLICLTILTILSLNHLVYHPTLGTLIGAMYILTAVPRPRFPPSYKRLFLVSEISLIVPFILSSFFYAALLRNELADSGFIFFTACLSFGSVVYIACAKLKIDSRLGILLSICIPIIALAFFLLEQSSFYQITAFVIYMGVSVLTASALIFGRSIWIRDAASRAFARPELIIITYFASLALLGSILLQLPAAQSGPLPHSFLDSFFTAMSAVCVTGLTVLDTPVDFTTIGQSIILILIQLGGLGIVSMSAWMIFIFQRRKLSIHHEQTIAEISGYRPSLLPNTVIRRILVYFASFELAGTLVLFWAFLGTDKEVSTALWRAIFTAISAFCNAGFALQSESLIPYQDNITVIFTVSILVIAGGIAPLLAVDIAKIKFRRLNLHAKLSLVTTLVLLVGGFIAYLSLEWSYSLSELQFGDRILNAWFQSVTTRTAGFNSIDLTAMRPVTPIILMILMFIGGNPGSAAGGVKTVTVAVVFCAGLSAIRGDRDTRVFNRSISSANTLRAISVIGLGMITGVIAFLALSVTQMIDTLPLLFETVSALGTVGLTLGVTANLDGIGKTIMVICMLAGRVGPLTFITLLIRRSSGTKWAVPEEEVYIS